MTEFTNTKLVVVGYDYYVFAMEDLNLTPALQLSYDISVVTMANRKLVNCRIHPF